MTKVLRLTITTIGLLALLLLTTGGTDVQSLTRRGAWSFTGSLHVADNHTATRLKNGKVLVAGGMGTSAELYNPTTGTWSLTGSLNIARFDFPMVLLPNGQALIAGGDDGGGYCCSVSTLHKTGLASTIPFSPCFCPHSIGAVERYDPTMGVWSFTGRMNNARVFHTLTPLPNNKVLAAGGERCLNIYVGNCKTLSSAEVYDLSTGTWTRTADLHSTRLGHTATRLTSTVLVAGGGLVSSELYNATTGTWSLTGSMNEARDGNTATRLANGQVLVAGPDASAELYTP